jgi:hypothetical protein
MAPETGGQILAVCVTSCACATATAKERGTYAALHKYYYNNYSANKQNRDMQTHERGRSAAAERMTFLNTWKQNYFGLDI